MASDLLSVTIRNRDGIVFQAEAKTLSTKNKIGKFDILKNHANFISIINDTLLIQTSTGEKKEFPVESGILKVKENIVDIYLGVGKK